MNPIRRELLNGVFVLVVASLMSTAVAAFQVNFNVQLWVLILMGTAMAVGGYVVFEFVRSNEEGLKKTEERELEWLKRVGNPARFELGLAGGSAGTDSIVQSVKAIRPGSDLTVMLYVTREGVSTTPTAVPDEAREQIYAAIMEHLKRGTIREYKRIMCFDHDVFANDHDLKSGILRVGEGPGAISRHIAEHFRTMLETKGCSLYVAPVVLPYAVTLYGTDKVSMTVHTFDQDTGARRVAGVMLFCDPPNGEIIEQFRQMERATERRIVAVHKIRFPEDEAPPASLAAR